MKLNKLQTIVTGLSLLISLSATAQIAHSQPQINQQINPRLRIDPRLLELNLSPSISGNIINGGSNNGGKPDFTCNQIEIYVAEASFPAPQNGGISLPQYQQIGKSTWGTGDITSGCQYTLPIASAAIGKQLHLFARSPQKWTTSVNAVDISPSGWANPIKINKNQQLKDINMSITATLIK